MSTYRPRRPRLYWVDYVAHDEAPQATLDAISDRPQQESLGAICHFCRTHGVEAECHTAEIFVFVNHTGEVDYREVAGEHGWPS